MPPLTPTQRAAVEYSGGPIAIVGGAGTGKTTVLTERFAWLCGSGRAGADSIVVLARDAEALRARIEARLEHGFEELHVVTFNNTYWKGWPSEKDPYAAPYPPWEAWYLIINRIQPTQ